MEVYSGFQLIVQLVEPQHNILVHSPFSQCQFWTQQATVFNKNAGKTQFAISAKDQRAERNTQQLAGEYRGASDEMENNQCLSRTTTIHILTHLYINIMGDISAHSLTCPPSLKWLKKFSIQGLSNFIKAHKLNNHF